MSVCLDCGKEVEQFRLGKSRCQSCAEKISIRQAKLTVSSGNPIKYWIPTKYKAYPVRNDTILVTDKNMEVFAIDKLNNQTWEYVFNQLEILAWRDLPEPYVLGYHKRA